MCIRDRATPEQLELRASAIVAATGVGTVIETTSVPGGGTLPTVEIPSIGLSLPGDHRAALRSAPTAIIARVVEGATILDLRTVDAADDHAIIDAIKGVHASS